MVDGDVVGTCVDECHQDIHCRGEAKCCSNGCGHICMRPLPGKCNTIFQDESNNVFTIYQM